MQLTSRPVLHHHHTGLTEILWILEILEKLIVDLLASTEVESALQLLLAAAALCTAASRAHSLPARRAPGAGDRDGVYIAPRLFAKYFCLNKSQLFYHDPLQIMDSFRW
ncbi:hypothetical protein EVAR_78036_1 [Eumeta japonica]|uniref:Uncharacterized protein n=1 Tax=Eumeta variegata TaxID=151549 RepID=A0A4C1T331_EUMVA|nr:hypothetical protein EVAR_78036_1 [Eumeta japonica]